MGGASLAATSGIHSAEDVIKLLMAGADTTISCSALLRNSAGYLRIIEQDLPEWMEEHEYESVDRYKAA